MGLLHLLHKLTPSRIFTCVARHCDFRMLSDETVLKLLYRGVTGRRLELIEPKRYTEKLQWMKLYDHNPIYTTMVDKVAAKEWAAAIIGQEHIIPTLGVWEQFDDIDFSMLPEQFVLKCSHDSRSVMVCRNKHQFDFDGARKNFERALKREYFYEGRQWPYKNVSPRIIAEKYMEDTQTGELRDYKFFTFAGEPKVMYIATGRGNGVTFGDFFDMNFNHLELTIDHDTAPVCPPMPSCFEEMKYAAAQLAQGTPQVRVDFYEVDGRFYFGEMTFFHCSGLTSFHPDFWDETFGSWVPVPPKG